MKTKKVLRVTITIEHAKGVVISNDAAVEAVKLNVDGIVVGAEDGSTVVQVTAAVLDSDPAKDAP